MILNDLAKYSVTRNIARPLCDNWASCWRQVYKDSLSVSIC